MMFNSWHGTYDRLIRYTNIYLEMLSSISSGYLYVHDFATLQGMGPNHTSDDAYQEHLCHPEI